MKKTLKTILIVLIVTAVAGACVGGYFIWRHHDRYISKNEALETALGHAELTAAEVFDIDIEFESSKHSAWYEVDFDTNGAEYEYTVDAASGEILYNYSEPERAG